MNWIMQVCTVVMAVSFTSMVAIGSLCVVVGAIKMLIGRDSE